MPGTKQDQQSSRKQSQLLKKFHALDEDGMASIGESLANGDVYINKYSPVFNTDQPAAPGG